MLQALIKGVMAFGTRLLMTFASDKVIEWAFFYLAGEIVKTTKTPHDDKFYAEIKRAYDGDKTSVQPKDY